MDLDEDKLRIARLGGPAKVAEKLGLDRAGGTQRVHNWLNRGIPAKVKVEHPELFLGPLPPPIAEDAVGEAR